MAVTFLCGSRGLGGAAGRPQPARRARDAKRVSGWVSPRFWVKTPAVAGGAGSRRQRVGQGGQARAGAAAQGGRGTEGTAPRTAARSRLRVRARVALAWLVVGQVALVVAAVPRQRCMHVWPWPCACGVARPQVVRL